MRVVLKLALASLLAANAGCIALDLSEMICDELPVPVTLRRIGQPIPDPEQPLLHRIFFGTEHISLLELMGREDERSRIESERTRVDNELNGLTIAALSLTRWSGEFSGEFSIRMRLGRAPGQSDWMIKALEPFTVHYYDADKQETCAIDKITALGDDFVTGRKNSVTFRVRCPIVENARWIAIEFGSTGLKTKLIGTTEE